jgi:hypothetical protein
MKSHKLQ